MSAVKVSRTLSNIVRDIDICESSYNEMLAAVKVDKTAKAAMLIRRRLDKKFFDINNKLSETSLELSSLCDQPEIAELDEKLSNCYDRLSEMTSLLEDYDSSMTFLSKLEPLVDDLNIMFDLVVNEKKTISDGLSQLQQLRKDIDTLLLDKRCFVEIMSSDETKNLDNIVQKVKEKVKAVYKTLLEGAGGNIKEGGTLYESAESVSSQVASMSIAHAPPKFEPAILTSFNGNIAEYSSWKRCYLDRLQQWPYLTEATKVNWLANKSILTHSETFSAVQNVRSLSEIWSILDSMYLSNTRVLMNIYDEWSTKQKCDKLENFGALYVDFKSTLNSVKEICENDDEMSFKSSAFPLYCRLKDLSPYKVMEALNLNIGNAIDLKIWDSVIEKYYKLSLSSNNPKVIKKPPDIKNKPRVNALLSSKGQKIKCNICSDNHYSDKCATLLALSIPERINMVKDKSLCYLCLHKHTLSDCKKKETFGYCRTPKCGKMHNKILCEGDQSTTPPMCAAVYTHSKTTANVCFPVQFVTVASHASAQRVPNKITCFFDAGSSVNLVRQDIAVKYNFKKVPFCLEISLATGAKSNLTVMYVVPILDNSGNTHNIYCAGVTNIGDVVSTYPVKEAAKAFSMSERCFDDIRNKNIDILVGFISPSVYPMEINRTADVVLLRSLFGTGYLTQGISKGTDSGFNGGQVCKVTSVQAHLPDFLMAEHLGIDVMPKCKSCKNCEECLLRYSNMGWQASKELELIEDSLELDVKAKKWTAAYVYETDPCVLENNFNAALAQYNNLKKSLIKKGDFAAFDMAMQEAIDRKVFTPETESEKAYQGPKFYVSLVPAYKNSETTPVRVCLNSSTKFRGRSLNECLIKGPSGLNKLFDVNLRFRYYEEVLCLDLSKFYNSVLSCSFDAQLRRVLWSSDPEKQPETFLTRTVAFGDKPGGIYTMTALNLTADMFKDISPEAAEKIKRDRYADDILTGAHSRGSCEQLFQNIKIICENGGFSVKDPIYSGSDHGPVKILGLIWRPCQDTLEVEGHLNINGKFRGKFLDSELDFSETVKMPTTLNVKQLWRVCMSQFDCNGFLGPFFIRLKLLMREIVVATAGSKMCWTAIVPDYVREELEVILREMTKLCEITFPRSITPKDAVGTPEIVCFCDGSSLAVCAIVFLRWTFDNGHPAITLFTACKTKVAPVHIESIPRLELMSALIGTRLVVSVAKALDLESARKYFFMDSTAALAMIKADAGALSIFGSHRVGEIKSKTDPKDWYWLDTKSNIADIGTRKNTRLVDLGPGSEYQCGPKWLERSEEFWPVKPLSSLNNKIPTAELSKAAAKILHVAVCEPVIDVKRYGSFNKAKRILAYVLKFVFMKSKLATPDFPSLCETASVLLFYQNQRSERESFTKGKYTPLLPLIEHCEVNFPSPTGKASFPIVKIKGRGEVLAEIGGKAALPVLDSCSHLSACVMNDAHNSQHLSVDKTVCISRLDCWIVRARKVARTVCRSCVLCQFNNAKPARQLMGGLEQEMLRPSPPFYLTCIDIFGPFRCKGLVNSRASKDFYGIIFVDSVSKYTYLDILTGYSGDDFLRCFQRFTAVCGTPRHVSSDMGTQLCAGRAQIMKWDFTAVEQAYKQSTEFRWRVAPSKAHHWVGQAEVYIREVKKMLKRKLCSTFTYEELQTTLFQVAYMLNSRPILGDCSEDSNNVLTPFQLVGRIEPVCLPDTNFDYSASKFVRVKHIEQLVKAFWLEWKSKVLPNLVRLKKWAKEEPNLNIDSIVMIKNDNPLVKSYLTGRIIDTRTSRDGKVRSATVRLKNGTIQTYSIHNLCPVSID